MGVDDEGLIGHWPLAGDTQDASGHGHDGVKHARARVVLRQIPAQLGKFRVVRRVRSVFLNLVRPLFRVLDSRRRKSLFQLRFTGVVRRHFPCRNLRSIALRSGSATALAG